MDYKALVENARRSAYGLGQSGMTGTEQTITALCDAVEALEKDANRWRWYAKSPQTALMLGSDLDPNGAGQDWSAECDRLADDLIRNASGPKQEASTPTPAAPSDA